MLAPSPVTSGPMPFSGSQFPEAERFSAWTRLLNKWLLHVESRQAAQPPFRVSAELRVLPDIRFGWGTVGGSLNARPRRLVARDNNDLILLMNLGGTFLASQRGRDIALNPGDAYVMACCEPGTYDRPTDGALLCIRATHDSLSPRVRNLHDRTGCVIPGRTESLKLLSGYVRTLTAAEPFASPEASRAVTDHLCDLLALSLGATSDSRDQAQERGLQAARLSAVKKHLERHLADAAVSPEAVAAEFRVSSRTLQRLFEREETTFSQFLLARRLDAAYGLLADPRERCRSIAEIALDCGFGDVSYFNRTFRERYDAAPSDVRHHRVFAEAAE